MDSAKNRDRRKIFTCLKPVTVDHVSGYDADAFPDSSEYECRRSKKNRGRRSFSGALKAVFVKSFLGKKLQSKKYRQHSFRSSSDKNEKLVNAIKKNPSNKECSDSEEIFTTNSNSSITASSRSSISSSSGSERTRGPISLDSKEVITNTVGMCVFVVCLFALVLGGKLFAIMTCTTMCLFFVRSKRVNSLVNGVIDSDESKKRVIMEGLLQRNRCRVL